jgi:hypothetical protein
LEFAECLCGGGKPKRTVFPGPDFQFFASSGPAVEISGAFQARQPDAGTEFLKGFFLLKAGEKDRKKRSVFLGTVLRCFL